MEEESRTTWRSDKRIGSPDFDDVQLVELPPIDLGMHRRRHPGKISTQSRRYL